jgi:ankyrin repeat protein
MSFQLSAIDDEELIHNAARQGHLISLEVYLNQNPKCINKLYTYDKSKWTPLLAACFYKHKHIVRMLLTRFKPDIDVVGTVNITTLENGLELFEDVSALWTAAAVNDFDIVKLLIEHGNANINQLMKTHSTALRCACYHNNLEMVRYLVEHGANPHQTRQGNYTNLMLSADHKYPLIVNYLVNEVKCNINERDQYGKTALYHAVKSESVEITKFLLEHGALNIRDNKRKVTPLMRAAFFGKISLVNTFEGYCSDLEWIEAKELLATYFSERISSTKNLNKMIEYLTEAFELRLAKNLPKKITVKPLEPLPYRRECETLEQFNQLVCSNTIDALHIEAIIVVQRLLGDDHNNYHDVLYRYGASLASTHQYHECFRWWFYEFDLKQKYRINFRDKYLQRFIYYFAQMKFNDQLNIPIDDLLQMFKIMNNALTSDNYRKYFDSNLITLLHLITIVAKIIHSRNLEEKQELSVEQSRELHKSVKCVIRHQYKTVKTRSSLLHLSTRYLPMNISSYIR